jgi:hypothetical protein
MGNRLSVTLISSLSADGALQAPPQMIPRVEPKPTPIEIPSAMPTFSGPIEVEPLVPVNVVEFANPQPPPAVEPAEEEFFAAEEKNPQIAPPPFPPAALRKEKKPVVRREPEPAPQPEPVKAPPPKKEKYIQARQEVMQFEPITRGRFEKSEPTIVEGQDLDVPTFLRKNVRVK